MTLTLAGKGRHAGRWPISCPPPTLGQKSEVVPAFSMRCFQGTNYCVKSFSENKNKREREHSPPPRTHAGLARDSGFHFSSNNYSAFLSRNRLRTWAQARAGLACPYTEQLVLSLYTVLLRSSCGPGGRGRRRFPERTAKMSPLVRTMTRHLKQCASESPLPH